MQKLSFEQAITQLENLIKTLEDGKLPLEEAVKAFEQGNQLRKLCKEKLENAQLKIEEISDWNHSGAKSNSVNDDDEISF